MTKKKYDYCYAKFFFFVQTNIEYNICLSVSCTGVRSPGSKRSVKGEKTVEGIFFRSSEKSANVKKKRKKSLLLFLFKLHKSDLLYQSDLVKLKILFA